MMVSGLFVPRAGVVRGVGALEARVECGRRLRALGRAKGLLSGGGGVGGIRQAPGAELCECVPWVGAESQCLGVGLGAGPGPPFGSQGHEGRGGPVWGNGAPGADAVPDPGSSAGLCTGRATRQEAAWRPGELGCGQVPGARALRRIALRPGDPDTGAPCLQTAARRPGPWPPLIGSREPGNQGDRRGGRAPGGVAER